MWGSRWSRSIFISRGPLRGGGVVLSGACPGLGQGGGKCRWVWFAVGVVGVIQLCPYRCEVLSLTTESLSPIG